MLGKNSREFLCETGGGELWRENYIRGRKKSEKKIDAYVGIRVI